VLIAEKNGECGCRFSSQRWRVNWEIKSKSLWKSQNSAKHFTNCLFQTTDDRYAVLLNLAEFRNSIFICSRSHPLGEAPRVHFPGQSFTCVSCSMLVRLNFYRSELRNYEIANCESELASWRRSTLHESLDGPNRMSDSRDD
jgi:hypothetical protein